MSRSGGNNDEEISQSESQSLTEPPTDGPPPPRIRRKADPVLIIFKGFRIITALTATLCIVVNVISAIRSFKNGSDIFNGIFRCYAVAIGLFVVAAETEWAFIFKYLGILEYWISRGMLQIFVAVMTRAFPDFDAQRNLSLLQDIASYLLLGCGLVYIIGGMLCIGFLKRARENEETKRQKAVKDLEELERRREELQALLLLEERT